MHNQYKILLLCRVYTAQRVSGTVVPIIRSPLQLPMQPLVTVLLPGWTCLYVQPGNHTVTRGCMSSWRGLLMMGTTVPETC
jgi:hypothetical protein